MPTYSFGKDSPLKFDLSEEYAAAFNRVAEYLIEREQTIFIISIAYLSNHEYRLDEVDKKDLLAFLMFSHILLEAITNYGKLVTVEAIQGNLLVLN